MNKHQEAINNLLALLNARLYEKKKKTFLITHQWWSIMITLYIINFIDWIFDVLIKKVSSFWTANENRFW